VECVHFYITFRVGRVVPVVIRAVKQRDTCALKYKLAGNAGSHPPRAHHAEVLHPCAALDQALDCSTG
jgi:hypothetical protein